MNAKIICLGGPLDEQYIYGHNHKTGFTLVSQNRTYINDYMIDNINITCNYRLYNYIAKQYSPPFENKHYFCYVHESKSDEEAFRYLSEIERKESYESYQNKKTQ